jgi:gliding motility-associated-like protein
LKIYNRWGQLVFLCKDINKGWDGRYKGQVLPGTYVYSVEYSFKQDNPIQQKGTIVVVR